MVPVKCPVGRRDCMCFGTVVPQHCNHNNKELVRVSGVRYYNNGRDSGRTNYSKNHSSRGKDVHFPPAQHSTAAKKGSSIIWCRSTHPLNYTRAKQ